MNICAITIWREARSQGTNGMRAVLHVILNRAAAAPYGGWPSDPERVCLSRRQFSCWNDNDPQRDRWPQHNDQQYLLAETAVQEPNSDLTHGATGYYDTSIHAPVWATPERFTVQIGNLRFYRL